MNRSKTVFILLCIMSLGIAFFSLMPERTLAFSAGAGSYSIPESGGSSCGGCHGGGIAPTVSLSGPNNLSASQTGSYILTIQSNDIVNQDHAGFNIVVVDESSGTPIKVGAFTATEAGTQVQFGDMTHMGARANDGSGLATFTFDWTAPAPITSETYKMYYSGNSVELNGSPGGDQFAWGSLDITVAQPLAVQLSETTVSSVSPWVLPLLAVLLLSIVTAVTTVMVSVKRPRKS